MKNGSLLREEVNISRRIPSWLDVAGIGMTSTPSLMGFMAWRNDD